MHLVYLGLFVLALGLAGCAPLEQGGGTLPAPAAQRYPADAGATAGPVAASINWQDDYVDPRLRALIAQALLHNTDLRTALLRVAEARAAYGITRAQQFPAIGLNAAGSVSRVPADLSLTGQALVSRDYQVGLQMNAWELDLWGRVRSLKTAALKNWQATDAARRAVTLALITQVTDG